MLKREQLEQLNGIRLKDGETKRIDCLFCGGKKTLTVSRLDGKLVWNCYKASCDAKGGKRIGRSIENIKAKLANPAYKQTVSKWIRPLPEVTSNPKSHEKVITFLTQNHSYAAWLAGAVKVTYDPAQDRVLFYMNGNLGAVGRTLRNGVKPKWLSYGITTGVLAVGDSDTAVVVEDAASACAVYATGVYTGVALLGTNISPEQRDQLKKYSKIIICLDKDASTKALTMARRLSSIVPTTVRMLTEDLKYLEPASIVEVLNNEGERYSHN